MNKHDTNGFSELYAERYFRSSFTYDPRRTEVWKEVCRFLQERYIPEDSKVMDLGAGYCDFINNIRARERHAVDIFASLEEYAHEDVQVHVQDCTEMDTFEDGSFDVVFASNLLEHLERPDLFKTLQEVARLLRYRGRLICLQPNFRLCYKTYFDDFTHIQIFTDRSLSELLESFDLRTYESIPRFLPVNMKSKLRFQLPFLNRIVAAYLRAPIRPMAGQMLVVAEKMD